MASSWGMAAPDPASPGGPAGGDGAAAARPPLKRWCSEATEACSASGSCTAANADAIPACRCLRSGAEPHCVLALVRTRFIGQGRRITWYVPGPVLRPPAASAGTYMRRTRQAAALERIGHNRVGFPYDFLRAAVHGRLLPLAARPG